MVSQRIYGNTIDAPWFVIDSQLLNEIMPMIYKRFTDKTSEEWRQIYKVRISTRQLSHQHQLTGSVVDIRVSNS
jgi:predicted KAP-like P-loop ATPase